MKHYQTIVPNLKVMSKIAILLQNIIKIVSKLCGKIASGFSPKLAKLCQKLHHKLLKLS